MPADLYKPDRDSIMRSLGPIGMRAVPQMTAEEVARREAEEQADADRKAEEKRKLAAQAYAQSPQHGLPKSFLEADRNLIAGTPEDRDAVEMLKAWRVTDPFGFLIVGPAGCGKSYALQSFAKDIIFAPGFTAYADKVLWFSVSISLDRMRREMSDNNAHTKHGALNASTLFIDDLGAENPTEWSREQLYTIIEFRLTNGYRTFVSSNCTFQELKERYHERFVSRLKEMCVVVQLKGADRRSDQMRENLKILKARIKGTS